VPRLRPAMRKVRAILRLAWGQGLSRRQVGAALNIPHTTVADRLPRAVEAGLSWPPPDASTTRRGRRRGRPWAAAPNEGAADARLARRAPRVAPSRA